MPKQRVYQCKLCPHQAAEKEENWEHRKMHIPPDKLLTCDSCQFVTEYKHHLEYHLRNHAGIKPFQCDTCDYRCINKSMLKSHMKSHSSDYQYHCEDCKYATKYVHSLKTHVKKYNHHSNNDTISYNDRYDTKKFSTNSLTGVDPLAASTHPNIPDGCILDLRVNSRKLFDWDKRDSD